MKRFLSFLGDSQGPATVATLNVERVYFVKKLREVCETPGRGLGFLGPSSKVE
jgi:hypothetical protein